MGKLWRGNVRNEWKYGELAYVRTLPNTYYGENGRWVIETDDFEETPRQEACWIGDFLCSGKDGVPIYAGDIVEMHIEGQGDMKAVAWYYGKGLECLALWDYEDNVETIWEVERKDVESRGLVTGIIYDDMYYPGKSREGERFARWFGFYDFRAEGRTDGCPTYVEFADIYPYGGGKR